MFSVELGAEYFTGPVARRLHTTPVELDHSKGSIGGDSGAFENGAESPLSREDGKNWAKKKM